MGKSSGPPILTLGATGSAGETSAVMMKKRRKRRRKARADSMRREESGDYSEDDDMFTIDISSYEGEEMESNRLETVECGESERKRGGWRRWRKRGIKKAKINHLK